MKARPPTPAADPARRHDGRPRRRAAAARLGPCLRLLALLTPGWHGLDASAQNAPAQATPVDGSGTSPAPAAAVTVMPEITVRARSREDEARAQYPDLQPYHVLNPYRVAPSSRLSVQTFSADDISALQPLDVFDLLNHALGVLTLYQGRKVPYSVRIRGDLYFAYIIDGVYLPSEAGGRVLQSLPVQLIEQLDVVRDATALTLSPMVDFGRPSGAPNDGYIVIRTRRPLGDEAGAALRGESHATRSAQAWAGTLAEQGYLSAFGYSAGSDGRQGEFMARSGSGGLLRAGWQHQGLQVQASLWVDRNEQQIQVADPHQSTLASQRWQLSPLDTRYAAINLAQRWDARHTSTLTLSAFQESARLVAGSVLPGVAERRFDNREEVDHVDLKHSIRWDTTLLRAGWQHMRWYSPTGASYYEGYPRDERIDGGFVSAEHTLADGRWVLDLALRQDRRHVLQGVDHYYAYQALFQLPASGERRLPADRYLSLGAAWQATPGLRATLRAHVARQGGVEAVPALDNQALHPERQRKFEAGLAWSARSWAQPSLTFFDTRIANAKYPAVEARAQNGLTTSLWAEGLVHRHGFEAQLQGQAEAPGVAGWLAGHWDWHLGWTRLLGPGTTEDYGRSAPPHSVSATLQHRQSRWDATLALTAVSRFDSTWKAVDQQAHPIGGYTRVDANLGCLFALATGSAHLSLGLRNALDQRYETQLGYRDIGRVWTVALRLER